MKESKKSMNNNESLHKNPINWEITTYGKTY